MSKLYKCVSTQEEIHEYIGASKVLAFDLRTAADEKYRGDADAALDSARAHICGCAISVEEGTGIYIPVTHRIGPNMDEDTFLLYMKELLSDVTIVKVGHDLTFQSAMLYKHGIVIQEPVYDTMCAARLVLKGDYEFRNEEDSSLRLLVQDIFDKGLPDMPGADEGQCFDEFNSNDDVTVNCACAYADYALRLYYHFNAWFERYMPKHRNVTEKIESPTAVYIGLMQYNGLPLDIAFMKKCKEKTEAWIADIRDQIMSITGNVSIGKNASTKAFKDYLYDKMGLPVLVWTDSGQPSTSDEAMKRLKEYCDRNRPELSDLFPLVQEYRRLGKIESTYIDGYLRCVNPATGRIHPDIDGMGTDTGRMSCANPNAQNMPRKGNDPIGVRNFIRAPEGQMILSLDFSQIELRVGAFFCQDEVMLETYRNDGDIHAATTSVIFGISLDEALDKDAPDYKERRTIAKNVNFGIFYGISPEGLQKTLKNKAGIEMSIFECEEMLTNLKDGYKGLDCWQEEAQEEARQKLYAETWFGRRRYLPDIESDNWGKKDFAERCAMNMPVQGTAAEILKMAIGRILTGLPERPWLKPILQIHDELVFIVPEEHVDEAAEFLRDCMEARPFTEFNLPLRVEAARGQTYGTLAERRE